MSDTRTNLNPTQTEGNSFSYMTRDNNGDWHMLQAVKCNICKNFLMPGSDHPACRRQVEEQRVMEQEMIRQQQCLEQFGQILDKTEYERRLYPTQRVYGRESYNDQLRREAYEKQQARIKELAERRRRVTKLEELEHEIKQLKRQIEEDQKLTEEERNQGLEV